MSNVTHLEFVTCLKQCCFVARLHGNSKTAVLREMVHALVKDKHLAKHDQEKVLEALLVRERQFSTGMQYGVALPHAKYEGVSRLEIVVALHPEGIVFDSVDGMSSHIFIMTLSPVNVVGPHMRFLASVARLLERSSIRRAVESSRDKGMLLQALLADEDAVTSS